MLGSSTAQRITRRRVLQCAFRCVRGLAYRCRVAQAQSANPARQLPSAVRGFERLVIRPEVPIRSWSGSEKAPGLDYLIDLTIVGISLGMVYGLVALGISFIYSGLDIVHFAHGEVYMIGAFLGVTVLHLTGLNYPAVIVVAMLLTGLIAIVIERVFYRVLRARAAAFRFPEWASSSPGSASRWYCRTWPF
jgi:hypothetical protein